MVISVWKGVYRSEGGIWSVPPVNTGSQIPLISLSLSVLGKVSWDALHADG